MRSVAKGNYIKGKGGKLHAFSHVRYLQFRKGDDRDQAEGRVRLFLNADREGISGREVQAHIRNQNERGVVIHRIVLSPGMDGVDMTEYTRFVMDELERSKGQDLDYFATEHQNTDHDHMHVVLMGTGKNGGQVRLYREQYRLIREAGDRYLERHHYFTRYLDKEIPTLMKTGYVRDTGDDPYEWLLKDLKSPKSLAELDEERRLEEEAEQPEFDREKAIEELRPHEKIRAAGVTYHQYTPLEELLKLDDRLVSGEQARISKPDYQQLWEWIGTKQLGGDDYYEKIGEHERLQKLFDDELKRSLASDNSPPRSYRQYLYESRGRLLESHEKYELDTKRSDLKRELKELDEGEEADPERRREIEEQLEWLNELAQERLQTVLEKETKEEVVSAEKAKEGEAERADVDEHEPKTDARGAKDAEAEKDKVQSSEKPEQEKQDELDRENSERGERIDKEDEQKRLEQQEARDKEQKRIEQEDRDKEHERLNQEARDREQERLDREEQDRERERLDQEERDRLDEQARQRDEERRQADELAKQEAERIFKMQQDLERLRQQQLEQPSRSDEVSELQKKIDQVTREIGEAGNRETGDPLDRADPALDVNKDIDLEKAEPDILDKAEPTFDLDKDISDTWSLDDRAGREEHEIEDLLKGLEPDERDRVDPQSDISAVLFGENPELKLDEHEKLPEEKRMDNWEIEAFNPELIKEQKDRPDQEMEKELGEGEEREHDIAEQVKQSPEQVMQQQVQQAIQLQIQQTFQQPDKADDKEDQSQSKDKEQEQDQGGEHSR
jgi:hypothetical protein